MGFFGNKRKLAAVILALAATLIFNSLPAYALSSGDLVNAGSVWLETTLAVAVVFFMAMAFSLQIARGYFLRVLEKFTLRLGADIWWLAYVLIRDGLIFISFIFGLLLFFPGTFEDYPIAVPLMPVSVVLFGMALVLKLYYDADENRNIFRIVTGLIFVGTLLWVTGVVFVTETPLALSTLPSGVSPTSGFWYTMATTYNSQVNVNLALQTFYVTFAALGVLGILGFAHPLLHSRIRKAPGPAQQQAQGPVSPSVAPAMATDVDVKASQAKAYSRGALGASAESQKDKVEYIQ